MVSDLVTFACLSSFLACLHYLIERRNSGRETKDATPTSNSVNNVNNVLHVTYSSRGFFLGGRRKQPRGGLLSTETVGLTVPKAAEAYIVRRTPLVAPRTLELEQGAVKHVSRHFATAMLAKLDSDALAGYVARRKAEGAGNRTINIEVGVLRRVLKQFKLWHLVGEDYKPLPEPKDIGRALTLAESSEASEQTIMAIAVTRSDVVRKIALSHPF